MSDSEGGAPSMSELCPGVRVRRVISDAIGASSLIVGEIEIDPGSAMPSHRHNVEEGVIILRGQAQARVGARVAQLNARTGIAFPAGVTHSIRNVGQDVLTGIFTFPSINVTREWVDE